jgi:branched-chain amino acid transport system permease protein
MAFYLQLGLAGLGLGAIYALVALAIVIPFKASGVLNFGQGELATAGAYAALVLSQWHWPYPAVFLAVAGAGALFGIVIERALIRPIANAPAFTVVIATFAIGLAIRSAISIRWGDTPYSVDEPFGDTAWELAGAHLRATSLWILACTAAVTALLTLFFKHARAGQAMRAVAANPEAAVLTGIRVHRVYRWAWALSAGIGALAGLLVAPVVGVNPEIGQLILRGLVAAVIGGFTSIPGAVAGGIAVGCIETFAAVTVGSTFKNLVPFVALLALLVFRPHGLFGTQEVHRV